jgi:hypothetical protein
MSGPRSLHVAVGFGGSMNRSHANGGNPPSRPSRGGGSPATNSALHARLASWPSNKPCMSRGKRDYARSVPETVASDVTGRQRGFSGRRHCGRECPAVVLGTGDRAERRPLISFNRKSPLGWNAEPIAAQRSAGARSNLAPRIGCSHLLRWELAHG